MDIVAFVRIFDVPAGVLGRGVFILMKIEPFLRQMSTVSPWDFFFKLKVNLDCFPFIWIKGKHERKIFTDKFMNILYNKMSY